MGKKNRVEGKKRREKEDRRKVQGKELEATRTEEGQEDFFTLHVKKNVNESGGRSRRRIKEERRMSKMQEK